MSTNAIIYNNTPVVYTINSQLINPGYTTTQPLTAPISANDGINTYYFNTDSLTKWNKGSNVPINVIIANTVNPANYQVSVYSPILGNSTYTVYASSGNSTVTVSFTSKQFLVQQINSGTVLTYPYDQLITDNIPPPTKDTIFGGSGDPEKTTNYLVYFIIILVILIIIIGVISAIISKK